jgi:hypothetical protein
MSKYKLKTTLDQFNAMWKSHHATRDGTPTVKVDKEALANLLMDHAALCKLADEQ